MSVGVRSRSALIAGIATLMIVASIMTIETPRLMKPRANQRLRPGPEPPAAAVPSSVVVAVMRSPSSFGRTAREPPDHASGPRVPNRGSKVLLGSRDAARPAREPPRDHPHAPRPGGRLGRRPDLGHGRLDRAVGRGRRGRP